MKYVLASWNFPVYGCVIAQSFSLLIIGLVTINLILIFS